MWVVATADVRNERYEVNQCREREEIPNQEQDGVVEGIKTDR